jgi:hypothetical protein
MDRVTRLTDGVGLGNGSGARIIPQQAIDSGKRCVERSAPASDEATAIHEFLGTRMALSVGT